MQQETYSSKQFMYRFISIYPSLRVSAVSVCVAVVLGQYVFSVSVSYVVNLCTVTHSSSLLKGSFIRSESIPTAYVYPSPLSPY